MSDSDDPPASRKKQSMELARADEIELDPADLIDQGEALRILRCNRSTLSRMISNGEVTAHRRGQNRVFERAEIEGVAGREDEGNVLREATNLLRQAHAHSNQQMEHQERMMGVLTNAASAFLALTKEAMTSSQARTEALEKVVADQAEKIREADRGEMDQAIRMMDAEAAAERQKAMLRAGEAAIPILLARMTGKAESRDVGIAQGVRALAGNTELVARIRGALKPDELGLVDALLESATAKVETEASK